jgi:leucyl-tRNA synthetase
MDTMDVYTVFEKGIAYRGKGKVNWCAGCNTVIANEQVIAFEKGDVCERCGTLIEKREMPQWMLKITKYADRLVDDLEKLSWPEHIKEAQRQWIGRSKGAEIDFNLSIGEQVTVFTTRPDTLYGATYLVLAPEHPLVEKSKNNIKNWEEVFAYVQTSKQKDEKDRLDNTKEKTGVKLEGITAINPANNEEVPVFIADYVLGGYGTGAIMAVPAHDERDFAFALYVTTVEEEKSFNLFVKPVIDPDNKRELISHNIVPEEGVDLNDLIYKSYSSYLSGNYKFLGNGKLINSAEFDGMDSKEAKEAIVKKVSGRMTSTYRLRDWSIGRQRYWGVPIPIVYDPAGKAHVVPKEHLPWLLPEDVDFTPTGEPPLAKSEALKKRTEEIFGKGWTPEVETMDTFVDSSWYFLRYVDNKNSDSLSSLENQKAWMPIDVYFGGAEHTTMHLLYSRFWQKALFDLGLVTETEPYKRRVNRGLILGPDGNKMSKSKGNVIDPDEQVARVGADTVKMYLAFMGPYEGANYPFDLGGIAGLRRFLERLNGLSEHIVDEEPKESTRLLHKTIKKVKEDIEQSKFNTAISTMMIFINQAEKIGLSKESYLTFLRVMAPFAPHLTEELWQEQGINTSIHLETYPVADELLATDDVVTIGVQINGKLRGTISVAPDASEEVVKKEVENNDGLNKYLSEGEVVKFIYVPSRIVNIVIK